jgi:hypothetical protein
MVECLRERPGERGLVTAVSGLLTKPGLTVWGTDPSVRCTPSDLVADVQASTDVAPLDEDPHGAGVIATYTTAGPRVAAIIDLESGKRAVAACDGEALAARATQEDLIGARVVVEGRTFTI